MAFWEEAVGKAKETLDVACKKTGEVAAIQKQRILIAAENNKLDKDFRSLGKLFYEMIQDTEMEETEVDVLRKSIAEHLRSIEEMEKEINRLKNKKTCPVCGEAVEPHATFCASCGAKQEPVAKP